jgi:hypothetical protein
MKTLSVVKHLALLKSLLCIFVAAGVSPAECQATDTVATTETS